MKVKITQSCPILCDPMDYTVHGILQARILEWAAFPFQGIFQTQGSNPGLPYCRQILYLLSHQGSPRILEWVAYPFSRESSQPRNQTGVSSITGGFFLPAELPGKPQSMTRHAKSLQSCPTLCDPMDSSPPGSSIHRILQARILKWAEPGAGIPLFLT